MQRLAKQFRLDVLVFPNANIVYHPTGRRLHKNPLFRAVSR